MIKRLFHRFIYKWRTCDLFRSECVVVIVISAILILLVCGLWYASTLGNKAVCIIEKPQPMHRPYKNYNPSPFSLF